MRLALRRKQFAVEIGGRLMRHWKSIVMLMVFVIGSLDSASGADKIRIGYPAAVGHFITLPLADKVGFLWEEGIDGKVGRIRPPAAVPAVINRRIYYFAGLGPGGPAPHP